jgi:hypothetical protein
MKITDIMSRKNTQQPTAEPMVSESDRLRKQKEDIERELAMTVGQPTPPPMHEEDFVRYPTQRQQEEDFGNYAPQPQTQPQQRPMPQAQMPEPPMPGPEEKKLFRMSVYLENGQKLPIVFPAYPEEVILLLKNVDSEIEAGRMVTIGDFKFPGSRVMYIDLQGR